jgi:hypothetical protein
MSDTIATASAEGLPLGGRRARVRAQELWLQHLMRRETWDYAEALAWIVHRDPAAVGSVLGYGKGPVADSCADLVAAALTLPGCETPTFEACPARALLYALQAGDVRASGFDNGGSTRHVIPGRDWTDLALQSASPVSALILGDEPGPNAWRAARPVLNCWRRVMFDRETLLAKFRPAGVEPVREPATAKPLDLSESEQLCKLLLHLAGQKSAAQIARTSTATDFAVPERTVSLLLKKARDLLAETSR